MWKNKKLLLVQFILIFQFLVTPIVFAFSYEVSTPTIQTINPYSGEDAEFLATIIASSNNICTIICDWKTDNYDGNIGNPEPLGPGESKNFGFKVLVDGINGQASDNLDISCTKHSGCLWGNDDSNLLIPILFYFNYEGDRECQTNKEEDCTNAKTDCSCSSGKKCIDEISNYDNRGTDERECATYCGNEIVEGNYETCTNCPLDVGKCNKEICVLGSECEGGYCVHEKCLDKPYKDNDGFCDSDNGEDNKNSPVDCACADNERWNSLTKSCETWCGNGICEASEEGKCKDDCKWCGDGECNNNENCGSCENDCGVCENEELNKEIVEKTRIVVEKGLEDVSQKQKIITYSALGVIVLFLIFYFVFKIIKYKRKNGKTKKKKKQESKKK